MSTDKRIMSKTTYGKNFKSLSNLTDLIRSRSKPKTELEIENLVVKDMKRKIL